MACSGPMISHDRHTDATSSHDGFDGCESEPATHRFCPPRSLGTAISAVAAMQTHRLTRIKPVLRARNGLIRELADS